MNKEFTLDRNSLSQADTNSDIPRLTDKDMIRKSISKIKNGKAARPSDVASEMVKAARKAGVDMITELMNQIKLGTLPANW